MLWRSQARFGFVYPLNIRIFFCSEEISLGNELTDFVCPSSVCCCCDGWVGHSNQCPWTKKAFWDNQKTEIQKLFLQLMRTNDRTKLTSLIFRDNSNLSLVWSIAVQWNTFSTPQKSSKCANLTIFGVKCFTLFSNILFISSHSKLLYILYVLF